MLSIGGLWLQAKEKKLTLSSESKADKTDQTSTGRDQRIFRDLVQELAIFSSAKGQIVNNFSYVYYTISVTTMQLCCCSSKAGRHSTIGHGCVPLKFYLLKQIWPSGCCLPNPDLDGAVTKG